ncbi:MAG: hypothetical protein MUF23_05845 [Pirellula sp.]|jgi:hypothetical protein|nr:hypothetical protein [Pirellula sp.]
MPSLSPRWTGIAVGILFAPAVGIVTYLAVFFIALLSLTRIGIFEVLYRMISVVWQGNPLYWGLTMMAVHVVACTIWGCLSWNRPIPSESARRSSWEISG